MVSGHIREANKFATLASQAVDARLTALEDRQAAIEKRVAEMASPTKELSEE